MMTKSAETNDVRYRKVGIFGCTALATSMVVPLVKKGFVVNMIDEDLRQFDKIPAEHIQAGRIVPIVGDGTKIRDLMKLFVDGCEVFLALTDSDTKNILSCEIVKHNFGSEKLVARIEDSVLNRIYKEIGLITVSGTNVLSDLILDEIA